MKIVVRGSNADSWWEIIGDSGRLLAVSSRTYTRRSDAKKAAVRFTEELDVSYYYEPFCGIDLDIESPQ